MLHNRIVAKYIANNIQDVKLVVQFDPLLAKAS